MEHIAGKLLGSDFKKMHFMVLDPTLFPPIKTANIKNGLLIRDIKVGEQEMLLLAKNPAESCKIELDKFGR